METISTAKTSAQKTKKEWAKHLFTIENLDQKSIAEKTGISEKTVAGWIGTENWEAMRKSLLTTRKEQIRMLYDILDILTKQGKEALADNDPATNPDTNSIIKITAAIKKLENETGLHEISEIVQELTLFTLKENFEAGQIVNDWGERFVMAKGAVVDKLKR
jgi:uncharacterized protein YjcR